jgi:DNA invertase Pin-like site-specific DNA recombinase
MELRKHKSNYVSLGSDEMGIFGYARVSTEGQSLDLQIDALNHYGVEKIFSEKMTGKRVDRPQLQEMLKYLRENDTVVVWKLDRIGRSMKDLLTIVNGFEEKGIHFVSLKENIDTSTATGKLIFNIFASLAEFERDIISERTRAGLEAARARGREGGRPKKSDEKIKLALKMYQSKNYSIPEITEATGISKTTLYRYIKKAQN